MFLPVALVLLAWSLLYVTTGAAPFSFLLIVAALLCFSGFALFLTNLSVEAA